MELRQLKTFQKVALTLSFRRAAEELNYAQSTVSAQIQALEEELGVHLFDRLGRCIALTDAGSRLLSYSEKILNLAEQAARAVSSGGELEGMLAISAPESLCTYRLPAVLDQFNRRHPRVHLVFKPESQADLQHNLTRGTADLAFVFAESIAAPSLVAEGLAKEQLCILAHPRHALAARRAIGPRDLEGETLLLTEVQCSYRRLFERILTDSCVCPGLRLEFASIEAIKQCAITAMGIAILPRMAVARELQERRLITLGWTGPELRIWIQMVWHKDKWLSPMLTAFMNTVREIWAGSPSVTGAKLLAPSASCS